MAEIMEVTRWKVFEDVWSQPMYKICKDYGLSDNGLKKVCKRHDIPIPGTGYWNRVLAGYKQSKPILKGNVDYCIRLIKKDDYRNDKDKKDANIRELINSIHFDYNLVDPLPFTKKYLAAIRKNKKYKNKFYAIDRFVVSKENMQRVVVIMNNLVKVVDLFGGKIKLEPKGLIINIWNYDIEVGLSEKVDSYIPERPVRNQTYCYDQFEYRGSDKFTIHLGWGLYWSPFGRATFNDGKKQRVEELLPKVFTEIYQYTLKKNHEKLQGHYASMRKRRSEKFQQRKEVEEQKLEYKRKKLKLQMDNWHKANEIKAFAHDLMLMAKKNPEKIKSIKEFNDWVRFILKEAELYMCNL